MAEFALFAGFLGFTGGALITGITFGTRYVDNKLKYNETLFRADQPIVLPQPPAPIRWEDVKTV
jgi:hypothetical protein